MMLSLALVPNYSLNLLLIWPGDHFMSQETLKKNILGHYGPNMRGKTYSSEH